MKIKNRKKWAAPLECKKCGWRRTPEMPLTFMNIFFMSSKCPECRGRLSVIKCYCPKCKAIFPQWRFPKTLRMALWGGHYCKHCNIEIDKWGAEVKRCRNK